MQLQILKSLIEKSDLSAERLEQANAIVAEALTASALSSEQRDALVKLIQDDSAEKRETANALQEVADSVDALLSSASVE